MSTNSAFPAFPKHEHAGAHPPSLPHYSTRRARSSRSDLIADKVVCRVWDGRCQELNGLNCAQLPRYVNMLIKLFQVLYYVFLVVPSLDNMLEVKSSQKLMVHISPCGTHVKWLYK